MKSRRNILRHFATLFGVLILEPAQSAQWYSIVIDSSGKKSVLVRRSRIADPKRVSIYANDRAEGLAVDFVLGEEAIGNLTCLYSESSDHFTWKYVFKNEAAYQKWHQFFHSGLILSKNIKPVHSEGQSVDVDVHIEVV